MIFLNLKGGLGNQLFQYSAGRALALKYNCELKLDLSYFDDPNIKKVYRLDKFNLKFTKASNNEISEFRNKDNPHLLIRILERLSFKFPPYYRSSHFTEEMIIKLVKDKVDYMKYDRVLPYDITREN